MDLGDNYIQEGPYGYRNIYKQILFGAKLAKTPFIAIAEDDTLYPPEHFRVFRPKEDEVAYNRHRWGLFTWDKRMFSLRNRVTNAAIIAPREFMIDALEERFKKWPEGTCRDDLFGEVGRRIVEHNLKVKHRKTVDFYTDPGIVQLSHQLGICERDRRKRKRHAPIKVMEIWHWGRAEDIVNIFKGKK